MARENDEGAEEGLRAGKTKCGFGGGLDRGEDCRDAAVTGSSNEGTVRRRGLAAVGLGNGDSTTLAASQVVAIFNQPRCGNKTVALLEGGRRHRGV